MLAGRLEAAMQLGRQALEVTRTQKQQGYQAYALRLLGDVAAHYTPPAVEAAERQYREALALAEAIGMRPLHDPLPLRPGDAVSRRRSGGIRLAPHSPLPLPSTALWR